MSFTMPVYINSNRPVDIESNHNMYTMLQWSTFGPQFEAAEVSRGVGPEESQKLGGLDDRRYLIATQPICP